MASNEPVYIITLMYCINTSIGKTSAKRQINHFVEITAQDNSKSFICFETSGNFCLNIK